MTGSGDRQRDLLYAAEDAVDAEIGPALRRWSDVEAFVERVLSSSAYLDRFPDAPLDVVVDRRSRGARSSLAIPEHATILVRDGSWSALVVLHELAHLVAPPAGRHGDPSADGHGPRFAATLLRLVRDHCGIEAAVTLEASFTRHGVTVGAVAE